MGRTVLADLEAVERKTERFSERSAPASEFGLLVGSLSEKGKDYVYDLIPAPPMSVPSANRCTLALSMAQKDVAVRGQEGDEEVTQWVVNHCQLVRCQIRSWPGRLSLPTYRFASLLPVEPCIENGCRSRACCREGCG